MRTPYEELHVHPLTQLLRAARDKRICTVRGFGESTEARIAAAIEAQMGKTRRFKLAAAQYAGAARRIPENGTRRA